MTVWVCVWMWLWCLSVWLCVWVCGCVFMWVFIMWVGVRTCWGFKRSSGWSCDWLSPWVCQSCVLSYKISISWYQFYHHAFYTLWEQISNLSWISKRDELSKYVTLKFKLVLITCYTFFNRQLDFSSEPGVANEILENEPKSCFCLVL